MSSKKVKYDVNHRSPELKMRKEESAGCMMARDAFVKFFMINIFQDFSYNFHEIMLPLEIVSKKIYTE